MRSLPARLEHAATRLLFQLPPAVLVALSGGRPVVVDGNTLHPEMQFLIRGRELIGGRPLHEGTPDEARHRMLAEAIRYADDPIALVVRDFEIPGPAGQISVRHYSPLEPAGPRPLLVFFHGGAFVVGDLDSHDEPCRVLCHEANVNVLAVMYRRAPENPFPAAIDDAFAAFRWAKEHASELSADPSRIGVGGDSAGGNLSAVVSQLGREAGVSPAFQLLVYPAVDRTTRYPSLELFQRGFFLTAEDIAWADSSYMGTRTELRADPRISPLRATSLANLCPAATFTAGFDPLRDEGEAYAEALSRAGVPSTVRRFSGLIHGFFNMGGVSPAARAAVVEIALALRELAWSGRSRTPA
ncbi:MAG TPA: alpha/beta hydrolase [Polyangiaceae bacterium]|nr:alpha/beta hydrolase [Polyangiaceae bacterium]